MKITDHVYRESAPYLGGRPDDVYWVDNKYVRINGVWLYVQVGAGESDIIKDTKLLNELNALMKEV